MALANVEINEHQMPAVQAMQNQEIEEAKRSEDSSEGADYLITMSDCSFDLNDL